MFTQFQPPLSTHVAPNGIGNVMIGNNNDHSYPVYAFPEILRMTIQELHKNIRAPVPLVGNCVLSAISLACQSHIDVRRLDHLVGPVSLYLITGADSGDRKSALDDVALEPLRTFQKSRAQEHKKKFAQYLSENMAWNAKLEVILAAIKKTYKNEESTEDNEQALAEHMGQKPQRPRETKLIYNDATPSALAYGMYQNSAQAGLISNEGGSIIEGKASTDVFLLNSLWSGSDIHVDRRTQESFSLSNPRLTVGVLTQVESICNFAQRKRQQARFSGLFSRCLIALPQSTQGTRYIYNPNLCWPSTDKFKDRIKEILKQSGDDNADGTTQRTVLKFSPEAQFRWTQAYNCIEHELNPAGFLSDIRDFGSKAADNMARIAALFHYFDKQEGDISAETVDRAAEVMKWYLLEFKRLFSVPPQIPQDQADAALLEAWLGNFCHTHKTFIIKKNVALQSGPNPLRNKSRLNAALQVLIWRYVVKASKDGKTLVILLNPEYFLGRVGNGQPLI